MTTTARFGWPLPDDTDRLGDGAAAMRALGTAVDTSMPRIHSDRIAVALSGVATAALNYSLPAPFRAAQYDVTVTPEHSSGMFRASVTHRNDATSGGAGTIRVRVAHVDGANSTTTVQVNIIAVVRGAAARRPGLPAVAGDDG